MNKQQNSTNILQTNNHRVERGVDDYYGQKKIIHILNIDNFFPELFELCFPTVERYAKKHGYQINLITERKFPDWHINYEKMQVFEDGKDADVNVLMDADVLIHPMMKDFAFIVPPTHIGFNDNYFMRTKFRVLNKEHELAFLRDQRNIGVASNLVVAHSSTHCVFEPLDITPEQGKEICLIREGDIDEYTISLNLAKYGLKYCGITWEDWMRNFLVHTGTGDKDIAVRIARSTLEKWKKKDWKSFYPKGYDLSQVYTKEELNSEYNDTNFVIPQERIIV